MRQCGKVWQVGQATGDTTIWCMHIACWMKRLKTHTQNMKYMFLCHGNNGQANASECYVYTYIACLDHSNCVCQSVHMLVSLIDACLIDLIVSLTTLFSETFSVHSSQRERNQVCPSYLTYQIQLNLVRLCFKDYCFRLQAEGMFLNTVVFTEFSLILICC